LLKGLWSIEWSLEYGSYHLQSEEELSLKFICEMLQPIVENRKYLNIPLLYLINYIVLSKINVNAIRIVNKSIFFTLY